MSSSIRVKSGIARHGRALVSVILVQTVLILWLAMWAIGDYLNNQYVRAYVDGTVQADSLLIGGLFFVLLFGSILGMILRRRKHASVSLEVPKTRMKVPVSIPTKGPYAGPIVKSVTLTGQTVEGPKHTVELHPAVAALKADLSEARMSLGLASVGTGPGTTNQASGYASQKPGMGPQSTPTRPQTSFASQSPPSTIIRPSPPPTIIRPSPPPTVIRPMAPQSQPALPSAPGSSARPLPVLKVEPGNTPAAPRPMGLLPQPQGLPTTVKDVSTVITGIVPALKKKDSASPDTQNSSSQSSS